MIPARRHTHALLRTALVAFLVFGLAVPSVAHGADPAWLVHLNSLRALGKLPPVAENSTWSNGCWLHARYMAENNWIGHSEDPSNVWYSTEGDSAAGSSNCALGVGGTAAIDMWMKGPFHAVGIIDPELLSTGFGSYQAASGRSAAALDVIRGRGAAPASVTYPIMWPAEGEAHPATSYNGNEWPDPLSGSGWTAPSGPPVFLLVGSGGGIPSVSASSLMHEGQPLQHRVLTETTYTNSDSGSQSLGRAILGQRDAIVVMPRYPLVAGEEYTVSVTDRGTTHTWSFFAVTAPPPGRVDPTPPTVSDDAPTGWQTREVSLTLAAHDAESGVDRIEWTKTAPSGAVSSGSSAGPTATLTISDEGETSVRYSAINGDRVRSAVHEAVVSVDTEPPWISHTTADNVTVRLFAEDLVSGVAAVRYRIDGGQAREYVGPFAFTGAPGTHTLEYWSADEAGNVAPTRSAEFTVLVEMPPDEPVVPERLAAGDRCATAVEIARAGWGGEGGRDWTGVDDVVLASGDDKSAADPLAAAGLTWAYDAPILLVSAVKTPDVVKKAIAEIAADNPSGVTVHMVGGPVALPDARFSELDAAAGGVLEKDRVLSTGDRFDMAAAIARRVKAVGDAESRPRPGVAFVANGADPTRFSDALALAPVSASTGVPILLVQADNVPRATTHALDSLQAQETIIAGGPRTVSVSVASALRASRWSGDDRYQTAAIVATNAASRGYSSYAAIGVAARLPDALAGGAMVGSRGGVMLLTQPDRLPPVTESGLEEHDQDVERCFVFGGTVCVDERTLGRIGDVLR
jgi:putative cell wall-binding protein